MCGIAGALVYDAGVARLDRLLAAVDAAVTRGEDSFGVVRWSPSTGYRRHATLGDDRDGWLEDLGRPKPDEPTVFLHTSRAEPTTEWIREKSDKDIPPFVTDGIAVAHNGIVANDEKLARAYRLRPVSAIDTAVIPPLVARIGIWRAVAGLAGGAALAIFDAASARLVLCRNFMPLVVAWEPGIVCFASEAGFFPRAGEPFPPFQLWELPPYTAIELSTRGFSGPFAWGEDPGSERNWRSYPTLTWSQ